MQLYTVGHTICSHLMFSMDERDEREVMWDVGARVSPNIVRKGHMFFLKLKVH